MNLELIRLKHLRNVLLQGLDAYAWTEHIDFILVDEIKGPKVRTAEGKVYSPAWPSVGL